MHANIPDGGTWIILGDVTIDIGTVKGLVTVGVDIDKLEERDEFTLSLEDLQIIGIHPTEQSNGEFARKSFQEAYQKVGGESSLAALIIDQGSDVTKGAKLLQEVHKEVKVIHDISHKLALVLEKELTMDPLWDVYTTKLTKTGQLIQQTEFAALKPPKQRSKARFMNVARYISWQDKILQSKKSGNLGKIPEERYERYFGWLVKFSPSLDVWALKIGLVERVKAVIRAHGLSEDSYSYLLDEIAAMPLGRELESFIHTVFDAIYEEVEKLDDDQTLPAFTEVLESLFGSYKNHTSKGGHGINGNILTLATLVGRSQTSKEICKTMEETPVKTMLAWVKERVGDTVGSLRRQFFAKERTEFDEEIQAVAIG